MQPRHSALLIDAHSLSPVADLSTEVAPTKVPCGCLGLVGASGSPKLPGGGFTCCGGCCATWWHWRKRGRLRHRCSTCMLRPRCTACMSDGPCYIGCIGRQGTNGIRQIVDIVAGTVSHHAALSLKLLQKPRARIAAARRSARTCLLLFSLTHRKKRRTPHASDLAKNTQEAGGTSSIHRA